MKIETGEIYTLKYDVNEGSNEYLKAGTKVVIEDFDDEYVLIRESSKQKGLFDTYVFRDDLDKRVGFLQTNKPKQNNIVKSPTISQSDLAFLQEATKQLHLNPEWYTYRNDENSYIALRMENSINIFRIEPVANFEGVLN